MFVAYKSAGLNPLLLRSHTCKTSNHLNVIQEEEPIRDHAQVPVKPVELNWLTLEVLKN